MDESPAAVGGVGPGDQRAEVPQPGHRRGYVTLREARSLGDVADRASRMGKSIGEHRPDARRQLMEPRWRDGILAELHQPAPEEKQFEPVHVRQDISLLM